MADQRFVFEFEIGFTQGAPILLTAEDGAWRLGTSPRGLTLQIESQGATDEFTINPAHLMYLRTIRREVEPLPDQVSSDGTIKVSP